MKSEEFRVVSNNCYDDALLVMWDKDYCNAK
jgi:hypothetical protein